ncbi:MAG: RNA polymerase sigma factor [Myxococcales bacterium]|nr:RNA polymerase sigma factor [Myxococcales bacterium]
MGSSISREDAVVPSVEAIDAQARRRLEALAREHAAFLRGLARKLCRGTFDPEDLVQDVLMKAVANFDRLPADVNHGAWMARVMQNLFIDRLRSRASQRPIPIDDVVVAAPPPDEPTWWERLAREDVAAAVKQLPPELGRAFELFAFEGRSYKEIAAALDVPVATVGTRVLRARRRLRALLGGPDE